MNAHLVRAAGSLVIILRSRLVHKHRAKQALSMNRGGEGRKGHVHWHEGGWPTGGRAARTQCGGGRGACARMNAHLVRAVRSLVIILRSRLVHKHRAKQARTWDADRLEEGTREQRARAQPRRDGARIQSGAWSLRTLAASVAFLLLRVFGILLIVICCASTGQTSAQHARRRDSRGWPQGRVGRQSACGRTTNSANKGTRPMAGGCTTGRRCTHIWAFS